MSAVQEVCTLLVIVHEGKIVAREKVFRGLPSVVGNQPAEQLGLAPIATLLATLGDKTLALRCLLTYFSPLPCQWRTDRRI